MRFYKLQLPRGTVNEQAGACKTWVPKQGLSSLYASRCGSSRTPKGFKLLAGGCAKRHPRTANRIKHRHRRGRSLLGAALGYHQSELSVCSVFGRAHRFMGRLLRPLRGRGFFSALSGGVASRNPRLIAGNPTGCNRKTSIHLCITARAGAWGPVNALLLALRRCAVA